MTALTDMSQLLFRRCQQASEMPGPAGVQRTAYFCVSQVRHAQARLLEVPAQKLPPRSSVPTDKWQHQFKYVQTGRV